MIAIAVILACTIGFGFYERWFVVSTGDSGHEASVTITVDQDKIRADEKKVEGLGHALEKKAAGRSDEAQEPSRQP
jgi:hypothetical protein